MWKYFFPFDEVAKNSKIIICGGGEVGCDFVNQILYGNHCACLFIADRNHQKIRSIAGIPVLGFEHIKNCEYDKIVIAATRHNDEMYDLLLDLGVSPGKIVRKVAVLRPREIPFTQYPMLRRASDYGYWNIFASGSSRSMADDYDRLTKNLDRESVKTIDGMMYRSEQVARFGDSINYFDLWTNAELAALREDFFLNGIDWSLRNVVKLSNECYVYDGHKLPFDGFTYSVYRFKHGIEELRSIKKIANLDIIDAGGGVGDSASVLSAYAPGGKVHSFEPLRHRFAYMLKTIEMNKLNNVVPVNLALGSSSGGVVSMDGIAIRDADSSDGNLESVKVVSLDEYVERNGVRVGFIKTDLEGYEQTFLAGAMNTIRKFRPALSISIYHNYEDFFLIKPLVESWDLGYSCRVLKPLDGRVTTEAILLAEAPD